MRRLGLLVCSMLLAANAAAQSAEADAEIARILAERLRTQAGDDVLLIGAMAWCPTADTKRIACDSAGPRIAAKEHAQTLASMIAHRLGRAVSLDLPAAFQQALPPVRPGTSQEICMGDWKPLGSEH